MSGEHDVKEIGDLRPGDHLCCLFETEEEHRALVTPYILQGLERGEKVVYIVDAHTSEEILKYLESDRIEVQACLASGQLSILTRDDSYMREGTFDPDGIISLLRSDTDLAIEQGYACLRVTGEMTWALRGLPGSERLIEYESKLNEFFPGSLCMAICQYDRRRFSPEILLDVLNTHPVAVVGTRIYHNLYFMPTEEFLRADRAAAILAQRLRNLESRYLEDEALRESEETLQIIFDSMPGLLFFKDKNNILLRVNKTFCDALGMPAEEIEGRPLSDLFPDRSEQYWKDDLEVIESGKPKLVIQESMETQHGTIWLQTEKVPYKNPKGEVDGIIGFSVDITARKQAEEALREAKEEIQSIYDAIGDGIMVSDLKTGTILRTNPALASMLGYSEEELVGMNVSEVHPPEELSRVSSEPRKGMQGENRIQDLTCLRKDGSTLHVDMTGMNIVYQNIPCGVAIFKDITEHKRAEEELRIRGSAMASSINAIAIAALEGNLTYINRACLDIWGYEKEEEVLGRNATDFWQMEEKAWEVAEALRERGSWIGELTARRKDGSYFDVQLLASMVTDDAGIPIRLMGSFLDITERKRAKEELERINKELEAYASIVSHDLRGPITVVTSASGTIGKLMAKCRDKQVVDQVMEVADIIKRSSFRAESLVENLLSLARAGQAPSKVSEIAVRETVERVLEEKSALIEKKRVKQIVDDDLGSIVADPTHIYQLFTNVIGNAIAYNDNPDPEIRITHKEEDGGHHYQVRDNGSGIPPDDAEKIFLPLYRGKGGDTGIGLAIVKKIVNIYGGDIKVYNDGGACFDFIIKDFHPER